MLLFLCVSIAAVSTHFAFASSLDKSSVPSLQKLHSPSFNMHPFIGRSSSATLRWRLGNVGRSCFISHLNFSVDKPQDQLVEVAKQNQPMPSTNHQNHRNFHSSSTVLMMAKRKKNGGKSKRVKFVQSSSNAEKKEYDIDTIEELTTEQSSGPLSLDELFDEASEEERNVIHHAPVMPTVV